MSVSVVIPAYNVADIVGRAIQSALEQTVQPLEIIVVDDCSTDNTVAVVQELNNPLIRIVSTPRNSGCGPARNVGFKLAKGDWLAILDADDAFLPERLERMTAIGESTGADFVVDNQILWDPFANRKVSVALDLPKPVQEITPIDLFRNEHDFNFTRFSYGLLKPVVRRTFLERKNVYYNESLHQGQAEDFDFQAEVLFNGGKAVLISDAFYVYSLPIGPDGKPHTRYTHNFLRILEAHCELADKYKDRIDPELAAAMADRRKVLKLIHEANVARKYRVANQFLQYAWYVGTKPDLVRNLFSRTLSRVQKRLGAASG